MKRNDGYKNAGAAGLQTKNDEGAIDFVGIDKTGAVVAAVFLHTPFHRKTLAWRTPS
ncbi:hypothetical protein IHE33_12055 [Mycetohabitans endofungorum]